MFFDHRRPGFTLLEICLALAIGSLLILMAVPSISGLLAEQRLKESFERLDRLVAAARQKSLIDQQTCMLSWDKGGITLKSAAGRSSRSATDETGRLDFVDGETFQLRRPAALQPDAPSDWTFWSNGLCEPALIAFTGRSGSWLVRYDPLTAHGTFLESATP